MEQFKSTMANIRLLEKLYESEQFAAKYPKDKEIQQNKKTEREKILVEFRKKNVPKKIERAVTSAARDKSTWGKNLGLLMIRIIDTYNNQENPYDGKKPMRVSSTLKTKLKGDKK